MQNIKQQQPCRGVPPAAGQRPQRDTEDHNEYDEMSRLWILRGSTWSRSNLKLRYLRQTVLVVCILLEKPEEVRCFASDRHSDQRRHSALLFSRYVLRANRLKKVFVRSDP